MNIKFFLFSGLLLLLTSCATTQEVYLQSGKKAMIVRCLSNDMDSCYSDAGQACGTMGYNIFKKSVDGSYTKLTISCRDWYREWYMLKLHKLYTLFIISILFQPLIAFSLEINGKATYNYTSIGDMIWIKK